MARNATKNERTCIMCGRSIEGKRKDAKYCSRTCGEAYHALEREATRPWKDGLLWLAIPLLILFATPALGNDSRWQKIEDLSSPYEMKETTTSGIRAWEQSSDYYPPEYDNPPEYRVENFPQTRIFDPTHPSYRDPDCGPAGCY